MRAESVTELSTCFLNNGHERSNVIWGQTNLVNLETTVLSQDSNQISTSAKIPSATNEQSVTTSSDETKTRRIITPVENAPLDLLGSAGMSLAMPILKRVLPPVIGVVAVIVAAVWFIVR